jgi:spore coat polysaccharide biosynthesis predicted glycosyltransferase SpsG/CMP-N-acetylneuraminic acid synthetase|tara:strand:+ start:235 stop:1938 length:1704 start_codon:yes stop_codon:yes gene_type:complete
MSVIAIIPASIGVGQVPYLNMKKLGPKPLIAYSIKAALQSSVLDRVIVSTENEELALIAKEYGAEVPFIRPAGLARKAAPLGLVLLHCVEYLEKQEGYKVDIVVILEPGYPLLNPVRIDQGVQKLKASGADTVISMTVYQEEFWRWSGGQLTQISKETGDDTETEPLFWKDFAVTATCRSVLKPGTFCGSKVDYVVMDKQSSFRVDSIDKFWVVERMLGLPRVLIRVDGSREKGMGHVYSALRIARLIQKTHEAEIKFLMGAQNPEGTLKVSCEGFTVEVFPEEELGLCIECIRRFSPNVIVNDLMFISDSYMEKLKELNVTIVNVVDSLSDIELSKNYADVVINFLDEENNLPQGKYFAGPEYTVIDPVKRFREKVENDGPKLLHEQRKQDFSILITFGGSDPTGLTLITAQALERLDLKVNITIVVGIAYAYHKDLEDFLKQATKPFTLKKDVVNLPELIMDSDLIICSGGRTVYELAALGSPGIAICQNERELKRMESFKKHETIINLGLGNGDCTETILETVKVLLIDPARRKQMSQNGLALFDGDGTSRVADIIINSQKNII